MVNVRRVMMPVQESVKNDLDRLGVASVEAEFEARRGDRLNLTSTWRGDLWCADCVVIWVHPGRRVTITHRRPPPWWAPGTVESAAGW